jgi:SM-20-related protein
MPTTQSDHAIAGALRERGYVVCEDFLTSGLTCALADECRKLHQTAQLTAAAIGRGSARHVATQVRGDIARWFEPLHLSLPQTAYWSRMQALRQILNRDLFLGLEELEAHYALYPSGSSYARHRDRFRDDDARVVSSVCYLNSDWRGEHGGALRIHMNTGNMPHLDVIPQGGTLVLFLSADFEHEVLPATRERMSIAGWLRRAP